VILYQAEPLARGRREFRVRATVSLAARLASHHLYPVTNPESKNRYLYLYKPQFRTLRIVLGINCPGRNHPAESPDAWFRFLQR